MQRAGVTFLQRGERRRREQLTTSEDVQGVGDLITRRGEPRQCAREIDSRVVQGREHLTQFRTSGTLRPRWAVLPERQRHGPDAVRPGIRQRSGRPDRAAAGRDMGADGDLTRQPGRRVPPRPAGPRRRAGDHRGRRQVHEQVAPVGDHPQIVRGQSLPAGDGRDRIQPHPPEVLLVGMIDRHVAQRVMPVWPRE